MLYVDEHDFPEWHEFPYDLECMLPDVSETSHLMMAKFTSPLHVSVTNFQFKCDATDVLLLYFVYLKLLNVSVSLILLSYF